jgi:methionyl-tRNA formyltransferase
MDGAGRFQKKSSQRNHVFILHPSLLPKYRGGSPLQHQIIAGEKQSAVTILKANDKIDSGEIYSQTKFSLDGTLNEIFNRIADIGTKDTIDLINAIEKGKYSPIAQDESQATTFKRRKPEESEINFEDFKNKTSKELYNFIRALQDPYPEPFIVCKDGKKLYITGAHL